MPILRIFVILLVGILIQFSDPASVLAENDSGDAGPGKAKTAKHLADDPLLGIRWQPTLGAAFEFGRRERKPIFIAFSARSLANPKSEDC